MSRRAITLGSAKKGEPITVGYANSKTDASRIKNRAILEGYADVSVVKADAWTKENVRLSNGRRPQYVIRALSQGPETDRAIAKRVRATPNVNPSL